VNTPPGIAELVSHRGPMLLLDAVASVDANHIVTTTRVRRDGLFDRNGEVPAYVGIEYMAQAMSALNGYGLRRQGLPIRLGFLAGTRRFTSHVPSLRCGELLQVTACRLLITADGLGAFDCRIEAIRPEGLALLCEARVSAYAPAAPGLYFTQAEQARDGTA